MVYPSQKTQKKKFNQQHTRVATHNIPLRKLLHTANETVYGKFIDRTLNTMNAGEQKSWYSNLHTFAYHTGLHCTVICCTVLFIPSDDDSPMHALLWLYPVVSDEACQIRQAICRYSQSRCGTSRDKGGKEEKNTKQCDNMGKRT